MARKGAKPKKGTVLKAGLFVMVEEVFYAQFGRKARGASSTLFGRKEFCCVWPGYSLTTVGILLGKKICKKEEGGHGCARKKSKCAPNLRTILFGGAFWSSTVMKHGEGVKGKREEKDMDSLHQN